LGHEQIPPVYFSDAFQCDSSNRSGQTGSIDRNHVEVKEDVDQYCGSVGMPGRCMDWGNAGTSSSQERDSRENKESEITQSARIASSNQAGFDAKSHVTATCGKRDETPNANNQLRGKDLIDWALGNYTVDPVQNSKNRWKIRLRCRKVGCEHLDHLKIKTVSFMSDSGYKSAIRGSKKHASWKKQIIAENARALRKSD